MPHKSCFCLIKEETLSKTHIQISLTAYSTFLPLAEMSKILVTCHQGPADERV